jgi:hypothetical protein
VYVAIQTWDASPSSDVPGHPANPSAVSNSVLVPGTSPDDEACAHPPAPTKLTVFGARRGQTTDLVRVKARLEGLAGPLAGRLVRFRFQGRGYEATTGNNGVAARLVRIRGRARMSRVRAIFAGTQKLGPSQDRRDFLALREDSRLRLRLFHAHPGTRIKAQLRDLDSPRGVARRPVVFYLNGERVGSKRTSARGWAKLVLRNHRLHEGDRVKAVFRGGRTFLASRAARRWQSG